METIGELIEKLVIANIKLWMVKDAQTYLCCHDPANRDAFASVALQLERIDWSGLGGTTAGADLTALAATLDQLSNVSPPADLARLKVLIQKDIALCEARAALRKSINHRLGDLAPAGDNVKQYGN